MNTFEIYFSDLNEDAQKRLMEAVGITSPSEMNWDIDMCPIAMYDFEENEQKGERMYDLAEKNGKYLCNMIKALAKKKPEAILEINDFDDLIVSITDNIDYGDIDELCETLDVDLYWFDQFFKYDDVIEDFYFDYEPPFRRML